MHIIFMQLSLIQGCTIDGIHTSSTIKAVVSFDYVNRKYITHKTESVPCSSALLCVHSETAKRMSAHTLLYLPV